MHKGCLNNEVIMKSLSSIIFGLIAAAVLGIYAFYFAVAMI